MELANGVPTVAMGSFLLLSARAMAYDATAGRRATLPVEAESRMRMTAWVAFFLVSNVLGVAAFRAAMTLPFDEAFLPGVLTVPLVGLTAFGVTRVLEAWQRRDDE